MNLSVARRQWFSFSLRTLLVVTTTLSILLGLYVKSFRDHRAAIASIGDLKGSISYKENGPKWLQRLITDDKYFWNPIAVRFSPNHPISDRQLQSAMEPMAMFDDLTFLGLNGSKITDDGLALLLPLSDKLETLDIRDTSVSDDGIDYLRQLRRLTLLRIQDSAISSEGIEDIRDALPNCELEVK